MAIPMRSTDVGGYGSWSGVPSTTARVPITSKMLVRFAPPPPSTPESSAIQRELSAAGTDAVRMVLPGPYRRALVLSYRLVEPSKVLPPLSSYASPMWRPVLVV
eukprot:1919774-Rhodomonas_salina.2